MNGFTSLVRKVLISGMAALALVVQFGGAAEPALAAKPTFVVDDGGLNCLGSGPSYSTSIQAAIDDAPAAKVKTILVCPGTYDEVVGIAGSTGLTLKAAMPEDTADWPVITGHTCDCGGLMVGIDQSKNITLDSLKIVGGWDDGTTVPMSGILIMHSDVVVQNVSITNIRTTTIPSVSADGYGVWINDDGADGKHSVRLLRVNITDYQTTGVYVTGPVKLTLSESHIDAQINLDDPRGLGVHMIGSATGVPSAAISNNVIEGTYHAALYLEDISKASVIGNVMTDSISIHTDCGFPGANASGSKISGNTLMDGDFRINVSNNSSTQPGCDPTANNTLFSGNTVITDEQMAGYGIILFASPEDDEHTPQLKGTKLTGNRFYGFSSMVYFYGSAEAPTESKNVIVP